MLLHCRVAVGAANSVRQMLVLLHGGIKALAGVRWAAAQRLLLALAALFDLGEVGAAEEQVEGALHHMPRLIL